MLSETGHPEQALEQYQQALQLCHSAGDRSGEAGELINIGAYHETKGERKAAQDLYQQVLTLSRNIGDRSLEALALLSVGDLEAALGHSGPAMEDYRQALALWRNSLDRGREASAMTRIGNLMAGRGDSRQAVDNYRRALAIYRELGDRSGEAYQLLDIATTGGNIGQIALCQAESEKALAIFREIGERRGEALALECLGNVYRNTGHPQRAMSLYQRALAISRTIEDRSIETEVLLSIAVTYGRIGQTQEALSRYEAVLNLFRTVGARRQESTVLMNIGAIDAVRGLPNRAMESFEQALKIDRETGYRITEPHLLNEIGGIYDGTGRLQQALEYYQQALEVARSLGLQNDVAVALHNIGDIYQETGQYRIALEYFRQAQPVYRTVRDLSGEDSLLLDIGAAHLNLGQQQSALEGFRQALSLAKRTSDRRAEAYALFNQGIVYQNLKRWREAIANCRQALEILQKTEDRAGYAKTLETLAGTYDDAGQPQRAIGLHQQVLGLCRSMRNRGLEALTLANLADAERHSGANRDAATHFDQAIALLEGGRANLGGYTEAKSRTLQSQLPIYYAALRLDMRLNRAEHAFALAQQTKARSLLDLMAAGRIDLTNDLTPEERDQEQQLRQQADFLNQQMAKEGVENAVGAKKRFANLQEQLKQTEQQLQTLTDRLYAAHPQLAQKRAAHTASLAEAAALLPADTALLEYVVTAADQVTLFVVRQSQGKPGLKVCTLPLRYNQLVRQTAAFHAACADPRQSYQPLARQLYGQLLAPAASTLQGVEHLIICPDQALWDVPFAALLLPDGHTFLADRYQISYAYSATGMMAARTLRDAPGHAQPTGSLLVLANPDFGDLSRFGDLKDLPGQRPFDVPSRPFDVPSRPFDAPSRPFDVPSRPMDVPSRPFDAPSRTLPTLVRGNHIASLPGTQREADALAKLFPDAAIFTGDKAQEAVVKQEAGKYRYLHFATHGFCNDAAPMLSAIVLAAPPKDSHDDGFLTAREIAELKLNAELVVLSACNTARGEERSGEGVIGLSWALLVAGCPSEVVSQWSVDDASTATLMADFYVRLKAGEGKGTALAAAAGQLRSEAKYRHPYSWAPFILIGDWR